MEYMHYLAQGRSRSRGLEQIRNAAGKLNSPMNSTVFSPGFERRTRGAPDRYGLVGPFFAGNVLGQRRERSVVCDLVIWIYNTPPSRT